MNPLIQLKKVTLAILVVFTCFSLSPTTQAQLPPPPPDGGYPGDNTAEGDNALRSNTTGTQNTAIGSSALTSATTGGANTAVGAAALLRNNGNDNTACGAMALGSNSANTASGNTATGFAALFNTTSGNNNTAIGTNALFNNRISGNNIALGNNAGANITLGNNIDIGNVGVVNEFGKIRIGTVGVQNGTFIAGISGTIVANGVGVLINPNGKLGTVVSSARFKEAIKPMDKASEVILALKPVTFCYKQELDPDHIPQFGLVAEEVEKVNPDLVVRGEDGKPYAVRYDAVNAMLLNEFLKEHHKVEQMQKQIDALTAVVQKVSAQLELNKPAPQTALNNH